MRATFTAQTDFGAFDISMWTSRTANPSIVTNGRFPFDGDIFSGRFLMPLVDDGIVYRSSALGTGFTQSGGLMTGGNVEVIRLFVGPTGSTAALSLTDIDISAQALHNAIRTPGRADDRALLNLMLAGNDTIVLSNRADKAFGATGADVLFGNRGNDVLSGNVGNDTLYGGAENDVLTGGDGNDRLFGGEGRDSLTGGRGNDILNGGNGEDQFIFASTDGNDTIRGFQDNIDQVQIEIQTPGVWRTDLQPVSGGNTLLTIFLDSDPTVTLPLRIVIEGINPQQLVDDILVS